MRTKTPVSTLMQRTVCRVGLDDTVAQVERTLLAQRLSWVPVVDGDGTPVGVVSAVDLLRFHADRRDADTTRAWQLCTYKPVTVAPDTPIDAVARLMMQHRVHHLVVADAGGLRGVIASMDLVGRLAPRTPSRAPAPPAAPAGGASADVLEEEGPEPPTEETYEAAAGDRDDAALQGQRQAADVEREALGPADADWIDAEARPDGRR